MQASRAVGARSAFLGGPSGARLAAVRPVAPSRRTAAAAPQALFGGLFGGSKGSGGDAAAAPKYYICIDCGYIYDGDFSKAPGSYKCPVCKSPKSRFKVYKGVVKGKPNNTGAAQKQRFSARQW